MRFAVAAGALLLAAGCGGPPPPDRIAIDPTFDDEQNDLIEDQIDQWCESVLWCPEIVETAEPEDGTGMVINGYADWSHDGRPEGSAGYLDTSGRLWINTDREYIRRPEVFALTVLHELGHYGIHDEHGGELMAARPSRDRDGKEVLPPPCIDLESAQLWCENWHCPEPPRSTCGEGSGE